VTHFIPLYEDGDGGGGGKEKPVSNEIETESGIAFLLCVYKYKNYN
jgi:hypothetical protein